MALVNEGRFSNATHRCPYPERWQSWDDLSVELEVAEFLGALVRVLQPDLCVETGAGLGRSTHFMGDDLARNNRGHLYSFEVDSERVIEARIRCAGLPVTIIEGTSLDGRRWLPPGLPIDFAFFDSAFDARLAEFEYYLPLMHDRTIVAFHDVAPQAGGGQLGDWFDLRTQLERALVWSGRMRAIELPTPRGLLLGQVL